MEHQTKDQILISGLLCNYNSKTRILRETANPQNCILLNDAQLIEGNYHIRLVGRQFLIHQCKGSEPYDSTIPADIFATDIEKNPGRIQEINQKSCYQNNSFLIPTEFEQKLLSGKKLRFMIGPDEFTFDLVTAKFHHTDQPSITLSLLDFSSFNNGFAEEQRIGLYDSNSKKILKAAKSCDLETTANQLLNRLKKGIYHVKLPAFWRLMDPIGLANIYHKPRGYFLHLTARLQQLSIQIKSWKPEDYQTSGPSYTFKNNPLYL